jgi:signal transduction histidine kinase
VPVRFIPILHPAVPLWFLFVTTGNDLIKATYAAYILRRLLNGSNHPDTMSQLATYLGIAVFLVPALSALAGAATRQLLGYGFWTSWFQWFLGDALANLVLTPALLYWSSQRFRGMLTRGTELAVWVIGFALSLFLTFSLARSVYAPIAFCVPMPFLIWAATRFGLIGASTPLSLIALAATALIDEHSPLFSMGFESHGLLFLQVFLFVIAVPLLALAILIQERSSVERSLQVSEEKLRQNYEEVRFLAGKLISAQDDERRRIALELHDDVVQRLALLAIELTTLDKNIPPDTTQIHSSLSQLIRQTNNAALTLRGLSHQLHSGVLQYIGLSEALKELGRTLAEQHRIPINVEAEGPRGGSSDEVNLCIYRIAQEALSNMIKHSRATEAAVLLTRNANQLRLEIRDNGIGFNPSERSTGLGLISMRERVRLLNGIISIESESTSGTTIRVHLPLESELVGTERR